MHEGTDGHDPVETVEILDSIAEFNRRNVDAYLERVDAGTAQPVGDVEPLRKAREEMHDRGVEARALPGDAERRRLYRDAIAATPTAFVAATQGTDSDVHRELDALAFEGMLDNEAPEWSETAE